MLSQISPSCSPNVGEALAAQLAISLAASLLLDRFILEGDSEVVVLALQHPVSALDWRISPFISDSLDDIPFVSSCEGRKINRSTNFCAYTVAHWAVARFYSRNIPFSSPPFLSSPLVSGMDRPLSVCFL